MHRSILIDVIIELISNAESYDELVNSANYKILEKYNNNESKISFEIDPFNSHLS